MTMLAVNAAGTDILIEGGSLVEVSGLEEIRQHLIMRLKLWRGELWYNVLDGVDYADLVFPARDAAEVLGELRKVALATPGVTEATIELISFSPEKMVIRGSFIADLVELDDMIRAEFGPIDITGKG
jgi:hypothetical protein